MKNLIRLISSFLLIGYSPYAPGTVGSLAGLGLYWILSHHYSSGLYFLILGLLFIVGILIGKKAEEVFGKKDCRKFVLDEVFGILIALTMVPFRPFYIITGFILFRIFDILKPFPAKMAEKLPHGWGVMLDDAVAGIYTNLILQIVVLGNKFLHTG
ncbi:MAG: phosphatidylglycerophosphatase A [bacterium]|nr:phosphatidylglycerophosphatase A [bacterium]